MQTSLSSSSFGNVDDLPWNSVDSAIVESIEVYCQMFCEWVENYS